MTRRNDLHAAIIGKATAIVAANSPDEHIAARFRLNAAIAAFPFGTRWLVRSIAERQVNEWMKPWVWKHQGKLNL
jgi:hypothetical protein